MARRCLLLATVALAVVLGAVAAAGADGWIKLGERVVNDRLDRDVITVGADAGRLEAIRIAVRRRPVHVLDVTVHFANGGTQDVKLRAVIPAGGESRVVDLVGDDRVVTKVELTYEAQSRGRGKRATLILFGRR